MPPPALTPIAEKLQAKWLFVDLNSYFASVEQETRPELRGQPIGIVPIEAKTACVIAASYQEKIFGVKTGMRADEALQLCPHLELVHARPKLYVEFHHKIAYAIKQSIREQGKSLRCSIGLGPNRLLAKIAADITSVRELYALSRERMSHRSMK